MRHALMSPLGSALSTERGFTYLFLQCVSKARGNCGTSTRGGCEPNLHQARYGGCRLDSGETQKQQQDGATWIKPT